MENSHGDQSAQGADDKLQNKSNNVRSEDENASGQKITLDPNHQKPENSWSPGNESERQSNESESDRNFDKGGNGLDVHSARSSSNSLYTERGGDSSEQQHAGTITDHEHSELSNDKTWQTGSDEPSSENSPPEEVEGGQNAQNFTNQGIGGNVGEIKGTGPVHSDRGKKDRESDSSDD